MTYLKSHTPAPRLSGSIWILVSLFSLFLITACGGVSLEGSLNFTDPRAGCAANPFNILCTKDFAKEQQAFIDRCVADDATVPEGVCDSATTFICEDNPFPILCDKEEKYRDAQTVIVDACVAGTCSAPQQAQFCTDNPYHTRCDDSAYDTVRDNILATCGTATKHEHCHVAIVPVCEGNPFNIVCQEDTTYEDARMSAITTCNQGFRPLTSEFCQNAITATCVGAGIGNNPVLCDGVEADVTITSTCNANRFDTLCNDSEIYKESRREFCLADTTNDTRCPAVVSSTCTDNPFHGLCQTGNTYDTPRTTAVTDCISNPLGPLCAAATLHTCADNPFHALCSASSYDSARGSAVANCGDGTNVITTQLCIDAVAVTCEGDSADVFHAACIAGATQPGQVTACSDDNDATRCYLAEQINLCAEGREIARCAGVSTNTDIMACIVDPFATACVDDSGFDSYLVAAQGIRYEYCRADGVSATDTLCASYRACNIAFESDSIEVPTGCGDNFDTSVRDTCATNPFDPVCTATIYNSDKQEFCSINTPAATGVPAVNNLFHANCTADYQDATKRNTFCLADPFHASCNNNTDFANGYANARDDNCKGSTPHAKCVTPALGTDLPAPTGPSVLANTPKYADSFLTVTIAQDNAIAPALGDLFTPEVTAEVPGVDGAEPTTRIVAPEISIAAADIGPIVVGRRGGPGTKAAPNFNKDGWAYFTLTRPRQPGDTDSLASVRTSRHAVILPTTNLGAPLTSAPATAVWPGHFSTTENSKQQAVDFYINWNIGQLGFSNRSGTGIGVHGVAGREESRPSIAVASQLRIFVRFNADGQFYGSKAEIRDATTNKGLLNIFGFIGQEGVVAVFSDRENKGGSGGFTASNPDHRDYVEAVVPIDETTGPIDADSKPSVVDYEDWLDFSKASYDRTAPRQSEFLQTDNRRLTGLVNGHNAIVADFNSGSNFRSLLLRGDAKNGFAIHTEASNHYAGVFNTASLGAPITQTQGSAIWRGRLVAQDSKDISEATDGTISRLFDLKVDFTSNYEGQAGELSGTVIENIDNLASGILYTIDGRFNARGAISGTILRSEGVLRAPLTGIIGQEGAIGVFVSNEDNDKFAGGFVAVPNHGQNANYDIWARTTPLTTGGLEATPKAYNHWLQGGTGGINGQSRAGITDGSLSNLPLVTGILRLSDVTYRREPIGGSANNGVAFYTGALASNGQRYFYSGLFKETDLGKPLTNTGGSGDWVGQLVARQHIGGGIHHRYGDILLKVNYTPSGGTITGALAANRTTSVGYRYEIGGWFNKDGFVQGNVNTRRTDGAFEAGFLTGLIGQQGMLGSFVGPNFSGGFAARPCCPNYITTVTDYDDWLHYISYQAGTSTVPYNESGRWNEILVTEANAPYNISYGHSHDNDGARQRSYTVALTLGRDANNAPIHTPVGLTGGYSYMASSWNENGAAGERGSLIQRTFHAGLHPNTSVGRPLPFGSYRPPGFTEGDRTPVVATWRGHANIFGNKKWNYVSSATTVDQSATVRGGTEFRLSVNYSNRNFYTSGAIGGFLAMNGYWDRRGIMTGTVTNSLANYPDGTITGLIGRQGAIGVFISNEGARETTYGWTGGFIACPTVKANGTGRCAH